MKWCKCLHGFMNECYRIHSCHSFILKSNHKKCGECVCVCVRVRVIVCVSMHTPSCSYKSVVLNGVHVCVHMSTCKCLWLLLAGCAVSSKQYSGLWLCLCSSPLWDMPTDRHFWKRQYWHLFRFFFRILHRRSHLSYSSLRRMVRRKKPCRERIRREINVQVETQ